MQDFYIYSMIIHIHVVHMTIIEKVILLNDLSVNKENYRFEVMSNQKEAIERMIKNQGNNLCRLAEHILENRLSPLRRIAVFPINGDPNRFNVLEGNRRIIALKLLSNPELIDDPSQVSIKKRFKELHRIYLSNPINEVTCVVFDSIDEANKWIKLEHTGQNNGVGLVGWDTQQRRIFEERTSEKLPPQKQMAQQVMNLLQEVSEPGTTTKKQLGKLSITNLERMLSDPYVRSRLGIRTKDGELDFSIPKKESVRRLSKLVTVLSDPSFKVKKIYDKKDRENIINLIAGKEDSSRKKAQPAFRTCLIPKNVTFENIHDYPKLNRISHEFKKLKLKDFSNATAVLFRVFLELSCDCYIENHKLPKRTPKGAQLKLRQKISSISDHLSSRGVASKKLRKQLSSILQQDGSGVLGIPTLHEYVHNKNFSPNPEYLNIAWDNMQEFMELVWKNMK